MQFNFRPIPQDPEQLTGWLRETVREIQNQLQGLDTEKKGTALVTGNASIVTGLTKVTSVAAGLYDDPMAGAAVVSARPSGGSAILRVFTSAFALSTTPINVWWIAYGIP